MSQRIANPSLQIALLVISAFLAGRVSAQHVELGAFVDYGRPSIPGFPENAFGAGGRVNINLHRFVQAELETAYDVKYSNFVLAASSASVTLTDSRLGILHMNGGLKLQTPGGSFFLFFKGGANRYGPEQTLQVVTGNPINVTTSPSSLPAFTEGIFYPGGGIGFHAGPLGIRVDAGDEIYWSSGAHHNFRLTFGPTFRF